MKRIVTLGVLSVLAAWGCAKRVPLPYDQVVAGSRVWVQTTDGRNLKGDVVVRRPDRFVLASEEALDTLLVADVADLKARPQNYDESGRLISEK